MEKTKKNFRPTVLSYSSRAKEDGDLTLAEEKKRIHFGKMVAARAGIVDPKAEMVVASAFSKVPRRVFVNENFAHLEYEDIPLPIECGEVSIRPSLLARMIGLLSLEKRKKALLIGSGTGYSSAVLAACGMKVYALEINGLLAQRSRKLLDKYGFMDVLVRTQRGEDGWAEHAPYDSVLYLTPVSCIKDTVFSQLEIHARLVAAIGDRREQRLCMWQKGALGKITEYKLEKISLLDHYA